MDALAHVCSVRSEIRCLREGARSRNDRPRSSSYTSRSHLTRVRSGSVVECEKVSAYADAGGNSMKYPGIRHNAVSNTYFIIALPIVTGLVAVWLREVAPEMRGLGLA